MKTLEEMDEATEKEITSNLLVKRVPVALRSKFWKDFLWAVAQEYTEFRQDVRNELRSLYDIRNMSIERLREVSENLGVVFDSSVDDSLEFIQREVEHIPFKVAYKNTAVLYRSFIRSLDRDGVMFLYFFKASSSSIVRNSVNILTGLGNHDLIKPWKHRSVGDFTGFFEDVLSLDNENVLYLDVESDGQIWTLDTIESEYTSNHVGLEFFIDRVMTKEVADENENLVEREFLMTWEPLDFVVANMDFASRVVEVPHIGSQLSIVTNSSGVYDINALGYPTVPDLKLKAATTTHFDTLSSVFGIASVEFGIGTYDIPSVENPISMPTSLESRVAKNPILVDERYESGDWMSVIAEYQGQEINNFVLHNNTGYVLDDTYGSGIVDGTNDTFQGTLLFAPIQRGNVRFRFYSNDEKFIFEDDANGNLGGDFASGTIDYNSGQYQFTTSFIKDDEEELIEGDGTVNEINVILPKAFDIVENDSWLVFSIGGLRYTVRDDGAGSFPHQFIQSSNLNYQTGEISITFTAPIDDGQNALIQYRYPVEYTPDAGTSVDVEYYFVVDSIEITEAGIFDDDGNLLAYATFPPIEFVTPKHHVNVAFILNRNSDAPVGRLLAGTSSTTGAVDPELYVFTPLSASIAGTADSTAGIDIVRRLSTNVLGTSDSTAGIDIIRRLSTNVLGTSDSTAGIDIIRGLSANVLGTSDSTAYITRLKLLSASATGTSDSTAGIDIVRRLSTNVLGTSDSNVSINLIHALSANTLGIGGNTAKIGISRLLSGTLAATSGSEAILTSAVPTFTTTWQTDATGKVTSGTDQVKLPLSSAGTYNFTVDWGDGTTDTITAFDQAEVTHTYASIGTYDISITGTCEGWGFAYSGEDNSKLTGIKQWGNVKLHNDGYLFRDCDNISSYTATDNPDLSNVTDMVQMFVNITLPTGFDISGWDTSNVTYMDGMFINTTLPTGFDISGWDTSSVTKMANMFQQTTLPTGFNISEWDTSSVTDMRYMFDNTTLPDPFDLSVWPVPLIDTRPTNFGTFNGTTQREPVWQSFALP